MSETKKRKPKSRMTTSCHKVTHADHSEELPRLRRLRGQIDGIERMIEEGRYCVDILQQLKAVRSAIHALEGSVLRTHLDACVKEAFQAKNKNAVEEKIQEIVDLFAR